MTFFLLLWREHVPWVPVHGIVLNVPRSVIIYGHSIEQQISRTSLSHINKIRWATLPFGPWLRHSILCFSECLCLKCLLSVEACSILSESESRVTCDKRSEKNKTFARRHNQNKRRKAVCRRQKEQRYFKNFSNKSYYSGVRKSEWDTTILLSAGNSTLWFNPSVSSNASVSWRYYEPPRPQ